MWVKSVEKKSELWGGNELKKPNLNPKAVNEMRIEGKSREGKVAQELVGYLKNTTEKGEGKERIPKKKDLFKNQRKKIGPKETSILLERGGCTGSPAPKLHFPL